MADSNDTLLADLKARAAVRGYELLTDDGADNDRYYALDTETRVLAAEPMTLDGIAEWLDSAEADDCAHGEDGAPLERARDAAQTVAYDVRFLVEAALTLNREGEDDGPLERVLQAAWEKLVKLADDLDSVKWPKAARS